MYHDLTKSQKRALRAAAQLAHDRDRTMPPEDREAHYLEARNADLPIIVGGAVANGVIEVGDVETAARDLVADVAERIRAVIDARAEKPAVADEEEDEDPNAAVSVAAIVREVDALSQESTLYVNRRTGTVTVWSNGFMMDGELEKDDGDDPEWLQQAKAEGRELESNPDWCALLDRFDLDEYGMRKRFARNAMPAASRDLFDALSGRGAFGRFRGVINERGLQEEWEAFRAGLMADLIRFRLREKGIPFRK